MSTPARSSTHGRIGGRSELWLDQMLSIGSVDVPTVRKEHHFYARRSGQQDQPVLLLREGADGERTLLDPNALSATA